MAKTFPVPEGFELVSSTPPVPEGFELVSSTPPSAAAEAEVETPSISPIESGLRGAAQGVTLGLSDELSAIPDALALTRGGEGSFFENIAARFRESQQAGEAANIAAREANPKSFIGGEVVGTLGPLALTGGAAAGVIGSTKLGAGALRLGARAAKPALELGAAAKAISPLATRAVASAARGAGLGGTSAAGRSERTLGEEGFARNVARGAIGGAAVGGALPLGGAAASAGGRQLKRGAEAIGVPVAGQLGATIGAVAGGAAFGGPGAGVGAALGGAAGARLATKTVVRKAKEAFPEPVEPASRLLERLGRVGSGGAALGGGAAGQAVSPKRKIKQLLDEARAEGGQQAVNETEFILAQKDEAFRKLQMKEREKKFGTR